MHAIRKLRESGHATVADYEKILAPNVVFHSPVLIRTAEGREVVAKIFATSTTLREGAYTGEWKLDDRRTLLRWKGKIQRAARGIFASVMRPHAATKGPVTLIIFAMVAGPSSAPA